MSVHRPGEDEPTRRTIVPLTAPPDVDVAVPGSKSLTNRALVTAALAEGTSRLDGVLFADDTEAMIGCLRVLGVPLRIDRAAATVEIDGLGGAPQVEVADLDVRLSGTTARFVAPLLAAARGRFHLDGAAPFRARPMGPVLDALTMLGAEVESLGAPGHLPVEVRSRGAHGGRVTVAGDRSSQFLSGLLMVGPVLPGGLEVVLSTDLVSEPYVALTLGVMAAFGVEVERPDAHTFRVPEARYTSTTYAIEPDASAASYPLAAAAMTGGRVRVVGMTGAATQGDAGFAHVLAAMGAQVTIDDRGTQVQGTGTLRGIDVDLGPMSDTAQTLAVAATVADGPTAVRGIGFIRAKETDRIAAVVTELARCGLRAHEDADGFTIHPGTPRPTAIHTYDDHRMAMSFALLGLLHEGITILDPGCVAKTFPDYFALLEQLRDGGASAGNVGPGR